MLYEVLDSILLPQEELNRSQDGWIAEHVPFIDRTIQCIRQMMKNIQWHRQICWKTEPTVNRVDLVSVCELFEIHIDVFVQYSEHKNAMLHTAYSKNS